MMNITKTTFKTEKICIQSHFITGNFKVNPDFKKQITKINNNEYETKLFVTIKNTVDNPFPVDIEVIFSGIFTFDQIETEEEVETFLNNGAIQILFPFVRTIISSSTASALMQPLVLPIIDIRAFKNI